MNRILFVAVLVVTASVWRAPATQEGTPLPAAPFFPTVETPGLDAVAAPASDPRAPRAVGPIAPAGTQPAGALAGRIVFTSAGHGWAWTGSSWALGGGVLNAMNEDYGNLDQMTMFVFYCFNAGATVVPFRPVGHQTNEVVIDNVSSSVTWRGDWADSTSTVYYGQAGAVPYRFANLSATETATATYTPTIPAAGFYPVYTWVQNGANRTNQLYRIRHTGGEARVRVPHHMVGNGWVYLGTYYFNAGTDATKGAVVISNLGEGTPGASVVVADAIRFGNGMGDVDRGGGVSTYPREEECSRYWVQRSLGQGQSSTIYDVGSLSDDSDNVGAPIRMAVEMNRESFGNMYKRVYVGFHSNAGGGRGVLGLYNDPTLSTNVAPNSNTPHQYQLAQLLGTEVNGDLIGITSPPLEVAWYNRGANVTFARSDYAFGEINNNTINGEFDASIVEVAFHDDASDAKLLCDPKARNWAARASYQAVVRYMNQYDGLPLSFLPEPPGNVRASASGDAIVISWAIPVVQGGSGAPTNYVVYGSTDGRGFSRWASTANATTTALTLTNLAADTVYYFRVAAVNTGGESFPSETVGCRRAANPRSTHILYVNGFSRFDRSLDLRQTPTARQYKPPGHDANSGTINRVLPRSINAFDYVVAHGQAIQASSSMGFDSCQVQAVTNGLVNLLNYGVVVWACGNQSTADRTFNAGAQGRLTSFLAAGGHLFVSGAEVAWDLDRTSGPSASDRSFCHNQLHAALNGDANDDSGVFSFSPVAGSLFAGNAGGTFDDGSRGIYWVGYPDALTALGEGAAAALTYPSFSGGAAAVRYDGSAGGGKVVFWGFPFETITSAGIRSTYMGDILKFFSRPAQLEWVSGTPPAAPRLVLHGEPGLAYDLLTSTNLANWTVMTNLVNVSGADEIAVPASTAAARFYRARLNF